MGVQNLWQILAPVKTEVSIESLKGKKVAVDLAIWLVESQVTGMKMMQGKVVKPHLRNLFFRVSNFLRLGVKLVFVIDGTPPELKWEEMARRNEVRHGGGNRRGGGGWRGKGRGGRGGGAKKASRSHFACWLKECQELLELMGVPCIQSKGEAEAMCAAMNSSRIVDGCMTEDGDAFLYGARILYRNLNMATGKVDCYCMDDIETDLRLDRRRLVALAILLGCDYLPKGVPGIGKEVAMRFMKSLPNSVDPLILFQNWRGGCDSTCLTCEQRDVRKKSLRVEGFPNDDVIKEFLQNKERPPPHHTEWRRPLLLHLQQFNLIKMEWPIEYTQEKVVPLLTLYDLTHMTSDSKGRLQPVSIVKLRVRQGVQCVEVKWHKPDEDKENNEDANPFYTTVEERELFTSAYPEVMEQFTVAMETKKAKGRGKKKKETQSALQEEGVREEEHKVVKDRVSGHPCSQVDVPLILKPASSQVESCHGNKLRSREQGRSLETCGLGRSRAPSREETHHRDTDDENMLMKLISLSLNESKSEKILRRGRGGGKGGGEGGGAGGRRLRGKRAEEVPEDRRKKEWTQNKDKKVKPGKKCLEGKDLRSEKESLVGLTQKKPHSGKTKSSPLASSITLGTMNELKQVTEDNGIGEEEEEEEEEESFIGMLPLSQRLGCHSLHGFIPQSTRSRSHLSSGVSSNAAKSACHCSSDDESELGIHDTLPQFSYKESQQTVPSELRSPELTLADINEDMEREKHSSEAYARSEQFSDEESSETIPVETRPLEFNSGNIDKVVEKTKHSSLVHFEAMQPSVDAACEQSGGSSQEFIMDQGQFMPKEMTEISGELHSPHSMNLVKSTPEYHQDSRVSEVHTPCHKLTTPTHKVIDLTEDSPVDEKSMSAVYSAEEVTIHQPFPAVTLDVLSTSLDEKKDGDESTHSEEDITFFREKHVQDRLLRFVNDPGTSTSSAKNNISSFMKLNSSLAKFMDELSLVSNLTSVAGSFPETDDSVFVVEDEEVCLDDKKQERTLLEENSEEKKEEVVNVCQRSIMRGFGNFQETLPMSEVNLQVPEGNGMVFQEQVNTKATKSENSIHRDTDSTEQHRKEVKNVHVILDFEKNVTLDSSTAAKQAVEVKFEDGELFRKETENINGEILDHSLTSTRDSSEATDQIMCELQHEEVPHPNISHNKMQNFSPHLPLEKKRVMSKKRRVTKTKKRHKLMKGSSLQDSILIENGLMKILETMSPMPIHSNSGSQQGTGLYSDATLEIKDPPHQSSCSAFQRRKPCQVPTCFSPALPLLETASSSSSLSYTSGSTSLITLNSPRTEQTASSIPEEPRASLANSVSGNHVTPCTKSSHLLRAQLLSMLSQLTPGDSPLVGCTVLNKPQESEPSQVGHQKSRHECKQQSHLQPVEADLTPCRDIINQSTQRNRYQEAIPDEGDSICECISGTSKMPLHETECLPNMSGGDNSKCRIHETHFKGTRIGPKSIGDPRHKLKPRSLSQPTRTVPSVNAKRNRSKHKSCSQPVRSHTRSRSRSSVKGFQRRESLLAMECGLAKILEGLSTE